MDKLEKQENKNLDYKIKEAISIMRKYAPQKEIYYLAYSGGKDSDVLLHLARCAGIQFQAIHNYTSIEDKMQRKHVLKQKGVKIIHPKKTMFQLIEEKGFPTRLKRWCCASLKHDFGKGKITMTGIRKAESIARQKRAKEFIEYGSKKNSIRSVNPLLNWTESNIWEYIKLNNIEVCGLYALGYKRVGCVGCPLAPIKQIETDFNMNPRVKKGMIKSMNKYLKNTNNETASLFLNGQDAFNWWLSKKSIKQWQFEKNKKPLFDLEE